MWISRNCPGDCTGMQSMLSLVPAFFLRRKHPELAGEGWKEQGFLPVWDLMDAVGPLLGVYKVPFPPILLLLLGKQAVSSDMKKTPLPSLEF